MRDWSQVSSPNGLHVCVFYSVMLFPLTTHRRYSQSNYTLSPIISWRKSDVGVIDKGIMNHRKWVIDGYPLTVEYVVMSIQICTVLKRDYNAWTIHQ